MSAQIHAGIVTRFDLYTKTEIFSSLDDPSPTAYLILAIGAQCRGASSDLSLSSSYFSQGQRLSFEGMICDPGLDMVRNFLLMAFYMLGACHRNASFM